MQANRTAPPDFINSRVEELSGGKPFRHIDDLISQDQLRRMSDDYKTIAGFSLDKPDDTTVDAGSGLPRT